jgi:phage/plasmid-associated DNA primase
MPFLYGIAGTGKSLVIDILMMMFAASQVGNLSTNQEQTFGLEGLYDKNVVFCREAPKEMSKMLSQVLLQAMISGEDVSVPCKGIKAKSVKWTPQLMMAGNFAPDYIDESGQIGRRMVFFLFEKYVSNPDPMLKVRIVAELPSLIWRLSSKYLAAAKEHASRSFWDWCPAEVLKAQDKIKSGMSHLGSFLALHKDHEDANIGPEHNRQLVYTERSDHLSTTIQALNDAFMGYMREKHRNVKITEKINKGTMERRRFEVRDDTNYCKHCNMNSSRGPCCDKYNRAHNRSKAQVVVGLVLVRAPVAPLVDELDEQD